MSDQPNSLADLFMLRPGVTFLNHGSFGACPRSVFEAYQNWQLELELQPVDFFQRKARPLMSDARAALAEYVGALEGNLVFVTNASLGINIVARSLDLQPGDEVLTTDHEYGSLNRTWELVCERRGAKYLHMTVELPIESAGDVIEAVWSGVTDRTKVLFLSHITSPTALILPVEELIRRAKNRGILTVIDGAHASGQIPLDLEKLGADFYVGNCHKWMMAPKGSGFLYAAEKMHKLLKPLIGGQAIDRRGASQLIAEHQYQGTRDLSAFLSVPVAIRFMKSNDWPAIRSDCHEHLRYARDRFSRITGLAQVVPDSPSWFSQMTILPIPSCDGSAFHDRLHDDFEIEIPVTSWNDQQFLRIAIQAYNSRADVDRLADAVSACL